MYCLDTDVLSALVRPEPSLRLVRRLAAVPASEQCTTAVTLGELLVGAAKRGSRALTDRVEALIRSAGLILPFDEPAARVYAEVRVELEDKGRRLDEPDLRIAAIALSRDLTLLTGTVRHFERVPGLRIDDWLSE